MLVVLVASYKKAKFSYLCQEINVKIEKLEAYLQELILDGRIDGKLDLVSGFFENYALIKKPLETEKNAKLESWIRILQDTNVR